MAAAKDQRKCWLMLLLFVYKVCLPNSVQVFAVSGNESGIVERVSRRQNGDIYFLINNSSINCKDKTYLISKDQCVMDQELFKGCTDAIVPSNSLNLTTIAVLDTSSAITESYLLIITKTGNFNGAIFKINETNQVANNSYCHISSLEVYRGSNQAIDISNRGFSLSKNGSIKITAGELGYNLEDYIGELYRMNLSCSGGLPESGCLFFKVQARRALNSGSVTKAKFNCTVPGTLYDFIEECDITISSAAARAPETTSSNSIAPTSYTITSEPGDEPIIADLDVIYVLAGLGGGILILTIVAITMCTIYFCLRLAKRKRQTLTITVAPDPPRNVYAMEEDEQPHDGEIFEDNEHPITSRPTVLSLDSVTLSEDTEHVYAVLEQMHLQQPTIVAQQNETMLTEQAQQIQILQETVPSDDFQHGTNQTVGLKSRSATWASAQQLKLGPIPKPRHENLELVQIYDNVIVEPKGRAVARDMANGASHPGNYRKHSLPADLSEHLDSMAIDASQDCPASNGPNEMADESIPTCIYSKPDMSKKREERQKKREQKEKEERMVALQNDVSFSSSPPPPPQVTELESEPQESDTEISIETGSGVVIDGQQQTDSETDKHKFGKQIQIGQWSADKVPQGNDECLYDTPTSLDLIPKGSKNITQGKEKEDKEREGES